MTSASHLQRAHLMLQHRRYDLAEQALRQALVRDPEEPRAHALLAMSLAEQNKPDQAERAAEEAVRLDPEDPDAHALLGSTFLAAQHWDEALAAADRGLAADAEHATCANIRATALTKLGRKDEAYATIRKTLADDPLNADTHASQGWAMLHANQPRAALEHFREALRLEPELDWARAGMVEALKARNPIYRALLAYFLWMSTLSTRARWGVIIGLYVVFRLARALADNRPDLAPFLWPLVGLYLGFVLLTWLGPTFFNALLRLHPHGRYALNPTQRLQSNWFLAMLVPTLACLAWWLAGGTDPALFATLYFALTMMHVTALFNFRETRIFRPLATTIAIVAAGGAATIADLLIRGDNAMPGLFLIWLLAAVAIELYIVFGGSGRPKV